MRDELFLILVLGIVTYCTRFLGHFIIVRFGALHPRLESALEVVPIAVLTTLVIPPVLDGGMAERVAFLVALALVLRIPPILAILFGLVVLALLRQVIV